VPRWYWKAKQHVQSLFAPAVSVPSTSAASANSVSQPSSSQHVWLVNTYDGQRQPNQVTSNYQRATDLSVSTTDPDASPMNRFPGDQTHLGYHTHYVVDGGKARIILAALVTPAPVQDNTPMLDLARWVRFRWKLKPHIAVGDTRYGTIANIVGLEEDGLRAYVPIADHRRPEPFYPAERFRFDAARECYVCPQDQILIRHSRRQRDQVVVYRAKPAVRNACPVKAECTASRSGRHIFRSFFQDYVDRVRTYHVTSAYQKALRKRLVWVEPLFAEIKQWHHLTQFHLRGLHKVNVEGLIAATGQNLKRLLNHWRRERTRTPATMAARLFTHTFLFLQLARSVFALQAKRLFQQALLALRKCVKHTVLACFPHLCCGNPHLSLHYPL